MKEWMTIQEVADMGVILNSIGREANYHTIRRLVKDGDLKAKDVSSKDSQLPRYLIKKEWVEDYKYN